MSCRRKGRNGRAGAIRLWCSLEHALPGFSFLVFCLNKVILGLTKRPFRVYVCFFSSLLKQILVCFDRMGKILDLPSPFNLAEKTVFSYKGTFWIISQDLGFLANPRSKGFRKFTSSVQTWN